jgi:hypothetical protein
MEGESVEVKFKAIHCFIAAEVEEGGVWVDVPLVSGDHSGAVIIADIVGNYVYVTVLDHLVIVLVRPL